LGVIPFAWDEATTGKAQRAILTRAASLCWKQPVSVAPDPETTPNCLMKRHCLPMCKTFEKSLSIPSVWMCGSFDSMLMREAGLWVVPRGHGILGALFQNDGCQIMATPVGEVRPGCGNTVTAG